MYVPLAEKSVKKFNNSTFNVSASSRKIGEKNQYSISEKNVRNSRAEKTSLF